MQWLVHEVLRVESIIQTVTRSSVACITFLTWTWIWTIGINTDSILMAGMSTLLTFVDICSNSNNRELMIRVFNDWHTKYWQYYTNRSMQFHCLCSLSYTSINMKYWYECILHFDDMYVYPLDIRWYLQ